MAATAVYASITRIPLSGVPTENVSYDNIAATTSAFVLNGGNYSIAVKASTYGTVTLQILGPDDTTYLTVLTAFAAGSDQERRPKDIGIQPELLFISIGRFKEVLVFFKVRKIEMGEFVFFKLIGIIAAECAY